MGLPQKRTPEAVEKVKMYHEMGWSNAKISREMHISQATVAKWLQLPDPAELDEELEALRKEHRLRFVDEAWDIIFKANELLSQKLAKGAEGCSAKELATVSAIMVDKISIIEARRNSEKVSKPPINIVIMPQGENGYNAGAKPNTVCIYDDDNEILGNGGGSREREDILRLPEGDEDGIGVSGKRGGDSSLDVPGAE